MFRVVLTRLLTSTNRMRLSSAKNVNSTVCDALRHIASQSNGVTQDLKVPLASIHEAGRSKRMGIQFRCKICDHRLQKTFTRQSYEEGVVIIRCDSCANLHLIADNLGWFKDLTQNGKLKNIAQMLQAKGETIHLLKVAPTDDASQLKAVDTVEKSSLKEEIIATS